MKNLFYLSILLIFISCKSQPKSTPLLQLSQEHQVILLDSVAASKAIIQDNQENFFSLVNSLDMSIQMGKNYPAETPREDILKDYKKFLQQDVSNFTKEETEFINAIFKEAYELCNKVSTTIFPKEIKLIKTHAKHYGKGAYYTRENCIIIPKDVLTLRNPKDFLETMFHEISHIYTRYHPEKRKALYELIGFKHLGNRSNLLIKEELNQRILLNPDGINFAYYIDLKETDGRNYSAIPIITSTESEFKNNKPDFFQYLHFSLYKVRIQHSARVISDEVGNSTVSMSNVPDFYEQITDNTNYIIHPDEIIADNFMYIMMRGKENGLNKEFSEAGTALIKKIKKILVE